MGINSATYWGGSEFRSRPTDLLYWLSLLCHFLLSDVGVRLQIRPQPLPSTSLSIHYLLIIISFVSTQLVVPTKLLNNRKLKIYSNPPTTGIDYSAFFICVLSAERPCEHMSQYYYYSEIKSCRYKFGQVHSSLDSVSLLPFLFPPLVPSVTFSCTACGQVAFFTIVIFFSIRIPVFVPGTLNGRPPRCWGRIR
jgi:hypothetical protein